MDGEYGHVPWFTACRERGLPFVTRLNRPKLFEDPEVLDRLRSATWYRVPDSLAGPRRAAADVGTLTVHAGQQTRRPDGERYEPVTLRVVAVDVADRQRRRKTWDQNVERNAAPPGTVVRVEVAGRTSLRTMLGERARSSAAGGYAG
jgi:hypothetical protein